MENNEQSTFGGLWIRHEPEYKIVVAFTSNGEQTLCRYEQYMTSDVAQYIEVRTVKKSLVELSNDQEKLKASLDELRIKSESRIDIVNNCISIDIVKMDEDKFNDAKQKYSLVIPDGLEVNFIDGLPVLTAEIYGGLPLWWPAEPGTIGIATTGFSVKNAAGTIKGITTAGHVGSGAIYYGNYSLVFQGGINGGPYDVQWRTCPGLTVTNKIQWWSDGSTFNVNSKKPRSEQHVGDIVSKYGRTTYYTAGQITSTSYGGAWIEVYNIFGYPKLADGGDSGGPWFTGNGAGVVALGISHAVLGENYAYYMAENYIESGLNMYVMTSP